LNSGESELMLFCLKENLNQARDLSRVDLAVAFNPTGQHVICEHSPTLNLICVSDILILEKGSIMELAVCLFTFRLILG
jgi:hypothetical protein